MEKYNQLDFESVLSQLSEFAQTEHAKRKIMNTSISNNTEEVRDLQYQLEKVFTYKLKYSYFDFSSHVNIEGTIKRVQKDGVLMQEELFSVLKTISFQRGVYKELAANNFMFPWLGMFEFPELYTMLRNTFDQEGNVVDSASQNLRKIRYEIKQATERINNLLEKILKDHADWMSESYVTIRNERYVIPVKNDFKNAMKGTIHDQSQSGMTVFIEPQAVAELNNNRQKLLADEKYELFQIFSNLSMEILPFSNPLYVKYQVFVDLEILFAKARHMRKMKGVIPTFSTTYSYYIKNGLHPLLLDGIKNDIILDDVTILMLSGPNAGGKTVVIKQLGLYSLMAQAGMAIPCEAASLPFFNQILIDIDTTQSLSNNLSTFAAHVSEISNICKLANTNTLVLLDEIGTGTNPKEGATLGIGVLEYLHESGAFTIVSTHYDELKVFGYNNDYIINATLDIAADTLTPLYKLLIGQSGESHAYQIATKAKLPQSVLARMQSYLSSKKVSEIAEFEEKMKTLAESIAANEKKTLEIDNLLGEQIKINTETKKRQNEILDHAAIEANTLIENQKKEIDSLLSEMKENLTNSSLNNYATIKGKANSLKFSKENLHDDIQELEVGDRVKIIALESTGEVIAKVGKKSYTIKFGNLTSEFKREELKFLNRISKTNKPKNENFTTIKQTNKTAQIDYRGLRLHEVEEQFESDLLERKSLGFDEVRVVHGHGTGVIRNFIQSKLKKLSFVSKFRYGGAGEGGVGATIVTFK